ncbi:odorant receptor 46a-like [Pseudomyrmex gracilis]|uniref:odorant receptor 46a-like n=1 Tax=Pseudomyrmex gracilis TaxID=219809 RepID=UPI0009948E41|nr:odorant receptor 46a-like [Pseudomyrmex gracilis]
MSILKFTLVICTIAGFWQPPSWSSLYKHIIYKIYALFLISSFYLFIISQFMNIVLNVDNSDELTDSMYMMLTVFVAGYKQVCIWTDRKTVRMIISVLTDRPFKPSVSDEVTIRDKFEKRIQINTLRYLTFVGIGVVSVFLSSVFMDFMKGNLTYKAWVPFDYSSPFRFTLVYINQMIGMSMSGLVNVACESLIFGLLLHTCCQFEILEYRLTKIAQNQDVLRDCIRHHNLVFQFAYTMNRMFSKIISVQFTVSMLVTCSNLYRMTMVKNYVQIIPLMLYTGCMLIQIFIYCWFGNEIKLKSVEMTNSIYNVEWLTLDVSNKRSFLIIMKRSMFPIEFSSAYIITMNLDSFVVLLKMSYSSFSLLRQAQE